MCGIAGILAYADNAEPVGVEELLRIREAMAPRGPDGAGLWLADDHRVGLAHRRLSIIDLTDAGAQPMASCDGRFRITFNGEIYNYKALRAELESKGYRFHSRSDTEVLLHLYADPGAAMLEALHGMYAFGIWDAREHRLFLARDPFGIKPLYYADREGSLRFASQVKALVRGGAVDTHLEALACGIPTMGSRVDGSSESLLSGRLGYLADPADLEDVQRGVLKTLRRGRGSVPEVLSHYSSGAFVRRAEAIVRDTLHAAAHN